jgi:hypothetical protein
VTACRHSRFEWSDSVPDRDQDGYTVCEAECQDCGAFGGYRRCCNRCESADPGAEDIDWHEPKPNPEAKPVPNRGALEARW